MKTVTLGNEMIERIAACHGDIDAAIVARCLRMTKDAASTKLRRAHRAGLIARFDRGIYGVRRP